MKFTSDDFAKELKSKNIRLSHQRLKVLEYLSENKCHPTVDQIYTSLHKEIPTLSKTTVYSTLSALADAGMVKSINIEDNEIRYDITVEDHGHFKCESCGAIFDFPADMSRLESEVLSGFKIRDKNVYFKGTCPMCLANKN
ncbi:MAG: transcriptional repressor [Bacillota bacterium]|jgi:Fe2+ or Zn2+ uptake regulation protein|nr:transcriptional repressor [Bacillota bacterium]